ncbi:hypothetical protein Tsubulata_000268 [Turnera subulata]|uniref:Uncharacterized protein n=1 Tax=Turnera subulata TaxID=218843 RepID=A0A9Q0FYB1_9ROSI|nr:hypothetical protein Tsubulata_000268 [Turnera subulata]
MPKRRVKKTAKQTEPTVVHNQQQKPQASSIDREVERQSEAIRALRDVEIEHALTGLRSLRSYFSQHLQTPLLQFFEGNLPNLSIVRNGEEKGQLEVQWKDNNNNNNNNDLGVSDGVGDLHASLLRRLSISYPDCSALRSFAGLGLSSDAVNTSFFGADNLHMTDFVFDGLSESQMLGMPDVFQTPGASSQRLSIGMTPKTLRLPKPGEMLLSVRGSPLGVYKEENMEAIRESEEG